MSIRGKIRLGDKMKRKIKITAKNFPLALGNVKANLKKIKEIIKNCEEEKVNILCLPELCLTGASLYDSYLEGDLLEAAENGLRDLVEFSKNFDLAFTIGLPIKTKFGIYNAVALIKGGDLLGLVTKSELKNYEKSIFSDKPQGTFKAFDYELDYEPFVNFVSGLKIGISVGEDDNASYPKAFDLKKMGADIILNPSAFTRTISSDDDLRKDIEYLSKDLIYVNASSGPGESSTDFVYSGTKILAKDGEILEGDTGIFLMNIQEIEYEPNFHNFTEEKIDVEKFPYLPKEEFSYEFMKEALEIGALSLIKRLEAIGADRVFLGLSGGIDSTMALLFINKAYELAGLDKDKIGLYTMPAFGTSDRTKSNAYKLAKSLGLDLKEINISKSVSAHLADIGHDGITADTAYENAQARMRTQVLFNLANMYGGLVIGTGDLSECMQGFATYNGDHMSNYSLNASLMKTELRYIIKSYAHFTDNKDLAEVLTDILATPVSPELKSEDKGEISQKTEEIIGPYELIDFFIYEHLTYHKKAKEILANAIIAFADKYDEKTIKKWLISYFKRFTASQFKRSCAVDGPNITGRSFSPRAGFRIASDMSAKMYLEDLADEN